MGTIVYSNVLRTIQLITLVNFRTGYDIVRSSVFLDALFIAFRSYSGCPSTLDFSFY